MPWERDKKRKEEKETCTWWALQDLNLGPMDYESTALTAELRAQTFETKATAPRLPKI
jgi:hypothetical protein